MYDFNFWDQDKFLFSKTFIHLYEREREKMSIPINWFALQTFATARAGQDQS